MGSNQIKRGRSKTAPARRASRLSPTERRAQLLACALRAFAERGLASANHADVARLAKVSVPTVFFYFNTRDALVDAVLTEIGHFYTRIYKSANSARTPAVDTLNQLTQALAKTLEPSLAMADYTRVFREWSVAVRSPIWPRYLKLHRYMTKVLSRVIARGQREGTFRSDIDPDDEALIMTAVSSALFQMMETGADASQLERLRRSTIQSLMPSTDKRKPHRAK